MSFCNNGMPKIKWEPCPVISNPLGDDPLNEYLYESKKDFNGNVTLVYHMPAQIA